MQRKKLQTVKIKESNRKILSVLTVIFMVAFLLRFEVIATAFNSLLQLMGIDTTIQQIQNTAITIANITIGGLLLVAGITFVSFLWVGVAFAVIGGVVLTWEALRLYNLSTSSNKISEPL